MRTLIASAVVSVALFSAPAFAACEDEYVRGAAPRLVQASAVVRELCYDDFAVGHSAATHTPLWSAEHLTLAEVSAARGLPRRDRFHAEAHLPARERAELVDYSHSGFDRGHLAPSGDMPTTAAQAQSFTLANIVPQEAALNRGLWEEIEETTRALAARDGEVFVVTGPIFSPGQTQALNGRVRVPGAMFKAIYDPRRRQAAAYVAENEDNTSYRIVSITQLRTMIGVDVFPSLPERIKARAMALPTPGRREIASAGATMLQR